MPNENTIYDSQAAFSDEALERSRRILMALNGSASDDEIMERAMNQDKCAWEDEKANLKQFFAGKKLLISGSAFTDGQPRPLNQIAVSFDGLSSLWEGSDAFRLYDIAGEFCIECRKDNQVLSCTARALTPAGEGCSRLFALEEGLAAALKDEKFSRKLHYLHYMYSCPEGDGEAAAA